ncbi:toll/interleukin-1 receptor domain-containing protein [Sphingomonas sp. PP-CC-3G-468]|uniref:toll/interleukin-1 receptor domain-containing protein n=1 Tax=Sphingomonas sp. PP-CC-3G-468 TaxID=2135656 RepID=UPI001049EA0D|nr:toll/interleukin-1 receptor domain-containing protein [Sphingomonas sp. PP-CC-3G-468]TCM07358.1 TIR domain-containing protein [Sphingomonas sp. PP-CC-3G-468]
MTGPVDQTARPKVYLAHATEDKPAVRPIAEHLMANGVEVWLDEWDIEVGESLRQQMEAGLEGMTHFVVVLTPAALRKPWVQMEIDAGILRRIGGESRFVPLLVGIDPSELPIFLRTMLGVRFDPASDADLRSLVDRLHGVSRRPALGPVPDHVRVAATAPSGWSAAAVAIARLMVTSSRNAMLRDPVLTLAELVEGTGMSEEDVRLATLELKDAGLIWEGAVGRHYAPEGAMFAEFDAAFMAFSPGDDAVIVANRMLEGTGRAVDTRTLAAELGWEARRMNAAICYLQSAGAIEQRHALAAQPLRAVQLVRTDETLRFARNRS